MEAKNIKFNLDKIKQMVYDIVGDEYSVLSTEYINTHSVLTFRNNRCGHTFERTFNNFKGYHQCPICNENKKINTIEKLRNLINSTNEYLLLDDEFKGSQYKYQIKHLTCGHIFGMRSNSFQQGKRCPECMKKIKIKNLKQKKTEAEWIEQTKRLNGNFTYISNTDTKVKLLCNKCNTILERSHTSFIQQTICCSICNTKIKLSRIHRYVMKYLDDNNIEYLTEVSINPQNIKSKVDILIKHNNMVIEIDGMQHFHFSNSFFSESLYRNDRDKNDIILNSYYQLLRIPSNMKIDDCKILLDNLFINNMIDIDIVKKYMLMIKMDNKIYNKKSYYIRRNKDYFNFGEEILN